MVKFDNYYCFFFFFFSAENPVWTSGLYFSDEMFGLILIINQLIQLISAHVLNWTELLAYLA